MIGQATWACLALVLGLLTITGVDAWQVYAPALPWSEQLPRTRRAVVRARWWAPTTAQRRQPQSVSNVARGWGPDQGIRISLGGLGSCFLLWRELVGRPLMRSSHHRGPAVRPTPRAPASSARARLRPATALAVPLSRALVGV
jgi:hypothetical protein